MKIRLAFALGAVLLLPWAAGTPSANAIMRSDLGTVPELDPDDLTNLPEPNGCVYVDAGNLELPYVDGVKLACMNVSDGETGMAEAEICVYDEIYYELLGSWGDDPELACLDAGYRWAFIGGPGACARIRDVSNPAVCVNGESRCLTTLLGRTYMCWA